MNQKAIIAMSGGVDSSVAALLTVKEGFECIGATMKLFYDEDMVECYDVRENSCCSLEDVEDARSVCTSLGMRHYVFNFSDLFHTTVIDRFIGDYENGRTPNPCIDCNRHLKFDKLFLRAKELGFDYVVTGHYARIEYDKTLGRYLLKKALDDTKDQSYVLYAMTKEQLAHTRFPLGALRKTEVRDIAEQNGFVNARKHDSQDICFVPDGDYVSFITRCVGHESPTGPFVDQEGRVLGQHKGFIRYTKGQHKGLGLAIEPPLYVLRKDPADHAVYLGHNEDLFTSELIAGDWNWISIPALTAPMTVTVKTRYSQREAEAVAEPLSGGQVRLRFREPQRAVTPGQWVVFYHGETCLGGGIICEKISKLN